eukprot:jgi/Chrpa1/3893/Chrysochromulina_OHIO_Genome00007189-RA
MMRSSGSLRSRRASPMRICQPPEKDEHGLSNSSSSNPSPESTNDTRLSTVYPPAASKSELA